MSQDIINNRFLEESVFAIADGYCVINLTKNIVRGSMYQVINGKKYNLNERKRLNFRHGYKNPRPHFCNRSTLIIHI